MKMDMLSDASAKEKSRNVFCKKVLLFFIDLHREGVSLSMLQAARKEIITLLRGEQ